MPAVSHIISLARLVRLEPRLARLAWQAKRAKKTFLSWPKLFSLVESFHILRQRHPGQALGVREFGVGRGGSALLLGWLVGQYGGTLSLYDVFGRIPPPTAADGEPARLRYEKILGLKDQDYYGNVPNLQSLVQAEVSQVCPPERIEIVAGRYEEVLPGQVDGPGCDLVHIDCDWYESSRVVLAFLKDRLNPGAILQIDDYGHWQGSRQAFAEADWLHAFRAYPVDDALLVDTGVKNPVT